MNHETAPMTPAPKYMRVADQVRAQIADGTLSPGESVPSGAALARVTGYSALTCRKALHILIRDGVLVPGPSENARPRVPSESSAGDRLISDYTRVLSLSLARHRRAAGLTQPQLARKLGLSVTTVGHAETGRVWQSRRFWEKADAELGASGSLLALHDAFRAACTRKSIFSQPCEVNPFTKETTADAGNLGNEPTGVEASDDVTIINVPGDLVACVTITWGNGRATTVYPPS